MKNTPYIKPNASTIEQLKLKFDYVQYMFLALNLTKKIIIKKVMTF